MKYSELIQFEPITSVIQLQDSADSKKAQELVKTYVISEMMAKRFNGLVFPMLRWDNPVDHLGMLVVGNYGTGKSHLMSVIASVAADASLVSCLRDESVRKEAETIAGKFKVIRFEIGGVNTSFRTIFVNALQDFLEKAGIDYQIPDEAGLTNNKSWLEEMMEAFQAKFPDQGLLMVVDEMLDYLRQLEERELIRAFGLMREIGEFAKDSRFRFIGGVQEMIFTSPRFSFVAESLNRVAQRFQTLPIERSDVKFVVAERLLGKTAAQKETVRKHLEKFAPCYEAMAAKMDDYCRMYPVHPDYIEVFERIACAERREVLKTLSKSIGELMDKDVPENDPGVIAFDSYWTQIKSTPQLQAVENIKLVTDCAKVLEAKVASLPKLYRDLAQRVIQALSVHRLTTPSINDPIGLTAANVRDMLCVYDPLVEELGGDKPLVLEQNVETAIDGLKTAVSGQYISRNGENKQYYIDVEKTIDVEENIKVRAGMLSEGELDRAYFEALKVAMEVQDVAPKLSYARIWEFDDLQWFSHKAPRRGYLFFGSPNERSTAQPPRDYYLYFLRPFDTVSFKDEKKADEVFFKLASVPEEVKTSVKYFAAALALKQTSSDGELRQAYESESLKAQKKLIQWLFESGFSSFEIIYKGEKKKASTWLSGVNLRDLAGLKGDQTFNFRENILALSGYLLEQYFTELAPEYPVFKDFIGKKAHEGAVKDALGVLSGGSTKQGFVVLEALKLLDGSTVSVEKSPYALKVRELLKKLPDGQVLNRDKLLQSFNQENYFELKASRLEEDYFLVVLAALVMNGEVVLHTLGHEYGASDLLALASAPLGDLLNFSHLSKPKDFSQETLAAVFELVGLEKSLVTKVLAGQKEPVLQLQSAAQEIVKSLAYLMPKISAPASFLGVDLLQLATGGVSPSKAFAEAKSYVEHLQAYDTPAKLKNLRDDPAKMLSHKEVVAQLPEWQKLFAFKDEKSALLTYLCAAADNLGPEDLWTVKYQQHKSATQEALAKAKNLKELLTVLDKAGKQLVQLKADYVKQYLILHKKARLDVQGDVKRQQLLSSPILSALEKLAAIEILPKGELIDFRNRLQKLVLCDKVTQAALEQEATCPHCHYAPSREGTGKDVSTLLGQMNAQLTAILEKWTKQLLDELQTATAKANLALLKPRHKQALEAFLAGKDLTPPLSDELVEALKEVLNGLAKVTFKGDDLLQKLKDLGPTKVNEFKAQLERMIDEAIAGKEFDKVRLVVE